MTTSKTSNGALAAANGANGNGANGNGAKSNGNGHLAHAAGAATQAVGDPLVAELQAAAADASATYAAVEFSAVGAAGSAAAVGALVADDAAPGAGVAETLRLRDGRPAVRMQFRAQSYDIDFANHMNNIAYLRWCEDLRLALLDLAVPLDESLEQGICPVVAETFIRYRRPIKLFDRVAGLQYVSAADERFFTTTTELWRAGELAAVSVQKLCIVDTASGRAIPLPESFRALGW